MVAGRFTVSARHRLGDRDRDEQQKEAPPNTATKGRSFDDSFCAAWLGMSSGSFDHVGGVNALICLNLVQSVLGRLGD